MGHCQGCGYQRSKAVPVNALSTAVQVGGRLLLLPSGTSGCADERFPALHCPGVALVASAMAAFQSCLPRYASPRPRNKS